MKWLNNNALKIFYIIDFGLAYMVLNDKISNNVIMMCNF